MYSSLIWSKRKRNCLCRFLFFKTRHLSKYYFLEILEYIYILEILFLYSNIRRKIYFVSIYLFQKIYSSLLFDTMKLKIKVSIKTVRRNIWIDVYCDIRETKVHIYTAIFPLPHFSRIELFFDLKSFENRMIFKGSKRSIYQGENYYHG